MFNEIASGEISMLVGMAVGLFLSFYNLTLGAFITLLLFFSGGAYAVSSLLEVAL